MKNRVFISVLCIFFSIFLISCSINNNNNSTPPPDNNKDSSPGSTSISDKEKNPAKPETPKIVETPCRIYFFDPNVLKLSYIEKNIAVEDNAIIKALTKELQNQSNGNNYLTLTDKVNITSAKVDNKTGILTVVFNDSYVDKMTLGSSTESGLLSSLLCTYGYNLGIDKVSIYFNNELYTGLKGNLPNGYFNVNYDIETPSDPIEQTSTYRVFYYDGAEDAYYYLDKSLKVTGKAVASALTNELKDIPKTSILSLPEKTTVLSANVDNSTGIVTVNLSKDYYEILSKVGSSSEAGMLYSLAYTYGYNFKVNKVIILIDGKPYSGSHILYKEGQYITVDTSSVKLLQ